MLSIAARIKINEHLQTQQNNAPVLCPGLPIELWLLILRSLAAYQLGSLA